MTQVFGFLLPLLGSWIEILAPTQAEPLPLQASEVSVSVSVGLCLSDSNTFLKDFDLKAPVRYSMKIDTLYCPVPLLCLEITTPALNARGLASVFLPSFP